MAVSAVFKRISAEQIGPDGPKVLTAYLFFQILSSHVFLPLLVTTFVCSKYAKRPATLVSMCCSWILSGVFACILLYAGEYRGPEPQKGLCIAQAVLLNGTPPMWSAALLAFVIHVRSVLPGGPTLLSKVKLCALLAAPYVSLVIWSIACAILAVNDPNDYVIPTPGALHFLVTEYSYFRSTNLMSLFTAIMCITAIGLQVHTGVLLHRNWRALRKAGFSSNVDLQLIIRLSIFELYIFTGMMCVPFSIPSSSPSSSALSTPVIALSPDMDISTIFTNRSVVPDLFASTIGFAGFLIFGLQSDVLRTWAFWLPPAARRLPPVYLPREPTIHPTFDLNESREGADDWREKVMVIDKGVPSDMLYIGREDPDNLTRQ
ncbi:hypothetical protein NEOLEDRAFT_1178506 [Neolentinus lepideus HHB14362 ss-1]|uniref:Fungal pheromone STE3G-protein-coupled receptor n=1 Tax=Neolentinus lepideus HHB14362 ss-1 TaxID=1314782 RepID=A0A165SN23_9AGAM|nr:hypothetical protein NEOLEDRAFT_1178506 [Neolentinus lepideus HHB14362 ss-1]